MADVKRASFAIEDQKEGGGNLWGSNAPVRGKVTSGKFTKEAPDGYNAGEGNPIFANVNFELAGDAPIEERQVGQSYALGGQSGDNFSISEDGDYLIPTNDDAAIVKGSKFGLFAASLQNNGVTKTVMQDFAFSKIAGLDGDWKRVVDPKRDFAEDNSRKKSKFPPATLCLVKLHALAGEKAAMAATASTPAASTAPAAAASTGDLDNDTWPYLETVLKGKGGVEQRGRLTLAVSKAAMKDGNRQNIARHASEESYINSLVEAGLVTYGAAEKGQPVTLVQ